MQLSYEPERETRYTYDLMGRVTHEYLPGGDEIGYTFDSRSNRNGMTKLTNQMETHVSYEYNLNDEMTREITGSDSAVTSYAYDAS